MRNITTEKQGKEDSSLAFFVTAAFLALGLVATINHEMWRDELQAWLLSRDSANPIELFRNLKYEGHPGLWHLLLMPLTRLFKPEAMQLLHLLIASTTVYLFVRYSPFFKHQKVLFAFGYFPAFEYSVISRNYSLGMLLVVLLCVFFDQRREKPIHISIILCLLAHTSAIGLIIAIAFTLTLFLEALLYGYRVRRSLYIRTLISIVIILIGISTALTQIIPPNDSGFATSWFFELSFERLKNVAVSFVGAYVPMPFPKLNSWGSLLLKYNNVVAGVFIFSTALLLVTTLKVMIKRPPSFIFFMLATLGLLAFFYIKFPGSLRHHGFFFIVFVAALWIALHMASERGAINAALKKPAQINLASIMLTVFLSVHVIAGSIALYSDLVNPFSNAKETAKYIQKNKMEDWLIIGYIDYAASAVVGYLGNIKMYYPQADRFGTFVIWDQSRGATDYDAMVARARKMSAKNSRNVLFVLNRPFTERNNIDLRLRKLTEFTGAIVGSENYYLYKLLD